MAETLVPTTILEQVARRFRLLGDPVRLQILNVLTTRSEANVQEIVEATGQSQANVSKHLRALADESLVGRRKDGVFVYYRVTDPTLNALCMLVCTRVASNGSAANGNHEETTNHESRVTSTE